MQIESARASVSARGRHRAAERARTLHLLDIENLVGGIVTRARVEQVWAEYATVVGVDRDDHVVAAFAKRNAETVAFALPTGVQLVIGANTRDGADIALTEAVDVAHDVRRFGRVAVGSGDGHCATLAARFQGLGAEVISVLGAARMSTALYLACRTNVVLPSHNLPDPRRAA